MLAFRTAALTNDLAAMERLWKHRDSAFNIDESGPKSGKTAAHVAAERGNFPAIHWLVEKKANFYCKDNASKTAIDYLQQKEFTSIVLDPMLRGDRRYYLCNAHYKIWLAHDPDCFMPYLYQEDFRQYREKNPDGYISLVYSEFLLSDRGLSDLVQFAEKYQITLLSFEKELAKLTEQFGTEEDKKCYQLASYELKHYSNQGGGNLAVVADLIRWSSVLLRKGHYTDTDVEIGQHKWTDSIPMEKPMALNLGSLIYPNRTDFWLNGDIIAVSSLFPHSHSQGDFRITLSKTACFIIQKVQLALVSNCQINIDARIKNQQLIIETSSDLSTYLKDFFKCYSSDPYFISNFSSGEMNRVQAEGLETCFKEERASIIERTANWMRKKVEQEFPTPEIAHKYSPVFQNVKRDEHEKFLIYRMRTTQMLSIKENVKQVSGIYVFLKSVWDCIEADHWKQYSIYSNEIVQSGFQSKNTVKLNTDYSENEWIVKTQKCADLSFTPLGMTRVIESSKELEANHLKN